MSIFDVAMTVDNEKEIRRKLKEQIWVKRFAEQLYWQ